MDSLFYDPDDDDIPSTSPPLLPIRPKLELEPEPLNWANDDEIDLEDVTNSDAPWHGPFQDRKRPDEWNNYVQLGSRKRVIPDPSIWGTRILLHEMDPRRGWTWATEAAIAPLPPIYDYKFDEEPEGIHNTPYGFPKTGSVSSRPLGSLRSKRQRRRLELPLLIVHPTGEVAEIMACPDSGSDENIISLEMVEKLGLKMDQTNFDEPKQFSVANGKTVKALGQVSTKCMFAIGASSKTTKLECIFHVFGTLAVPLIMGIEFLQQTETLSKHRDRLVEKLVPAMQALRVNSIGRPKRSLVCQLDTYVGCATVDTGSDLDLVSPAFAKSRGYRIEPAVEQLEFADCSVGYTSGVIKASFAVGNMTSQGFNPRGEAINLDLFVLESLTADILVGQDTIDDLDIFNLHNESLIPSLPQLGQSNLNIIRVITRLEKLYRKAKSMFGGNTSGSSDCATSVEARARIDQRENARREHERARIATLSRRDKEEAHRLEGIANELLGVERRTNLPSLSTRHGSNTSGRDLSISPLAIASPPASPPATIPIPDYMSTDGISNPSVGSYVCTFVGCTAPPFQTQYLLNSHSNIHSSLRPYYCPVQRCPRAEGGKGFKRKNEMIRHGLVHDSPGFVCPFCKDRERKYPLPDHLQRHVRVYHVDKNKDDPLLRDVLSARPSPNRGRRRRAAP